MKIYRAFKTELDLNNQQRTLCARYAGVARYTFNWGLSLKIEAYRMGRMVPTAFELSRELNVLKKTELAWMYEVSSRVPQAALRDLDQAYAHFFRRVKKKKAGKKIKVGFPRFKSKKNGGGSFRLLGAIHVFERSIQLPRLGLLRLKERGYLPTNGIHILSATISEKARRWFISLQVEIDISELTILNRPRAGVDLGISRMAQVSDGTYFEGPRALKSSITKIKRKQRIVSRRQKGSSNHRRALQQLSIIHARVANIRKDALHQVTTFLTRTKSAIVIENLNVSGMMKNHYLAQAIADVGMYEFRRQIIYKGIWYGCQVLFADRFYPSTKRCSQCGHVKEKIGLGEREYRCESCGLVIDRDLNAAINLEQLIN